MRILTLFLLCAAIAACNDNAKTDTSGKVENEKTSSAKASQNVRNEITVHSSGVNVQQAFLMFEDGKLVPQDNKVEVGQQVNMRLIMDGWEASNGKVMLGASEKIATDEGTVILNEPDMFAEMKDGVNAADAGAITLSAVITRVDKLFKYFEVSFKVWDKNSNDNVTGSYRLYLK
jgi:hypothetical protein